MRIKRELLLSPERNTQSSYYHAVSRCVNRQFFFDDTAREWFMKRMRQQSRFSGLDVLSFCLMSSHFHILLKVPPQRETLLEVDEFMSRLKAISSKTVIQRIERLIDQALELKGEQYETVMLSIQRPFLKRMHCLSTFMKELKLAFTQWFNRRKGMVGTQWEGRFKSVLVEEGLAAQMTSAYIDLNPVRAGMVSEPQDYRWSSYGAAMAGKKWAQQGLIQVMRMQQRLAVTSANDHSSWGRIQRRQQAGLKEEKGATNWCDVAKQYRMLVAEEGEMVDPNSPRVLGDNLRARNKKAKGYTAEEVEQILSRQGELTPNQLLRCRVRYFTDGAVLGSKLFVEEIFQQIKQSKVTFKKRKTGSRSLKGAANSGLFTLRDLRKDIFG